MGKKTLKNKKVQQSMQQQALKAAKGLKKTIGKSVLPPKASGYMLSNNTTVSFPPGKKLMEANLLRIHGNDKPVNVIEKARRATVPIGGTAAGAGPADIGTGSPAYKKLVEDDPRFRELGHRYDNSLPLQQNLTDLTLQSLINIPSTGRRLAPGSGPLTGVPINHGNLEGINLETNPVPVPGNPLQTMDFYDFESDPKNSKTSQQIVLSPKPGQSINPIEALIHEGRHAIDDLFKRPHQREMVNFLAEQERLKGITPSTGSRKGWLKGLLSEAQDAIPDPSFKNNYDYKGFFQKDVDNSLSNLSVPQGTPSPSNPGPYGFQNAKTTLDQIRANSKDAGDAFKGLSEFNAYMMEKLDTPWNKPANDASRRFTKENLRTAYRDYDELSGSGAGGVPNSLATKFPGVHQAFFDRYNELRNPKYVASSINDDPKRMQDAAAKIGVTHAEAPLGTVPGTKKELTPYYTTGLPRPFPPPKYTERAGGGCVTGKNLFSRFIKPKRKSS